jgi:mannose-6-phosphate isomerase-like protein (cupin superfamily)
MAKIILEPNEIFEHFHSDDSFTTLLAGEAKFTSSGDSFPLQLNIPVITKASQSHTIQNTGITDCIFLCGGHSKQ